MIGETLNMSRTGVLVEIPGGESVFGLPKPGDKLRVDIQLPHRSGMAKKSLHGRAEVIRVNATDRGMYILALRFGRMRFQMLPIPLLAHQRVSLRRVV